MKKLNESQNLLPTFCEQEEKNYHMKKLHRGKLFFISLIFILFVLVIASEASESSFYPEEFQNGCGTNWKCPSCGKSNKQYEMSCGNCGFWR